MGGSCVLVATTEDKTFPNGLNQGINVQLKPSTQLSNTPLILDVLNNNTNNAQWLITCPNGPNPLQTMLYFTANATAGEFVAGNLCLAPGPEFPLITWITLTTSIAWTPLTPALVMSQNYDITGIATGFTQDLAYSGLTGASGSSNFNLSSGYDSESYIFNQVPPSTQSGLWTWSSYYAVSPAHENLAASFKYKAIGPPNPRPGLPNKVRLQRQFLHHVSEQP